MPGKIKLAIFTLICSVTIIGSYIYSESLYAGYLRFWYVSVKGFTASDALSRANDMTKKHYAKLDKLKGNTLKGEEIARHEKEMNAYLDTMLRVFVSSDFHESSKYAEINELKRFAGLFFLDRGDVIKGAPLVLSSTGKNISRDEEVPFSKALSLMFKHKMYSDIVSELSWRGYDSNPELMYMYGFSLYKLKKHKDALTIFKKCIAAGKNDEDTLYMLASSFAELKMNSDALVYAKMAYEKSPKDRDIRTLLVSLLNKEGRYKEAAKISR